MRIDIANNIKTVELLKVELMQKMTDLFGDIVAEADSETLFRLEDDAANIINLTYLLCMRLGADCEEINALMQQKLKDGIAGQHIIEKRYGDLSTLLKHIG